MTEVPAEIEALRARLARCKDKKELERVLIAAAPAFHPQVQRRTLIGRRNDLGVRVVSLEMPYLGLIGLGEETVVALKYGADSIRRRQTLAHECAHSLLRDVDRPALGLSREEEDRLCSWFARRALMPGPRVSRYLAVHGFPADMTELRSFCDQFRVSLRAAIAALNEHGEKAGSTVFIAATHRAHEKRPNECAFRVDTAAAHPQLLIPRDRRLSSMGLADITRWAEEVGPGASKTGLAQHVLIRSRTPYPKCWHGPAAWSACVHRAAVGYGPDARSLVLILDRSRLAPMATDPTVRRGSLRQVSIHPSQPKLTPS
jgi:hypothetical protein